MLSVSIVVCAILLLPYPLSIGGVGYNYVTTNPIFATHLQGIYSKSTIPNLLFLRLLDNITWLIFPVISWCNTILPIFASCLRAVLSLVCCNILLSPSSCILSSLFIDTVKVSRLSFCYSSSSFVVLNGVFSIISSSLLCITSL